MEPDYSKCFVFPLYVKNNDHRSPGIPAHRFDLSGMDILDFP
jgi:hypothetical protein